ncbi:MAG TPA: glutathione S-transferase [Kofleriaceae bacterium]|nr:glutathione S-transferase [Kofleriaceae bacterium]
MITVHHLERSRSQRVLWLLEELGLEYELKVYKRDPKTLLAPAELRAVHPLGKSPVVVDGDRTIAESGAILEYLIERHGGGRFVPAAGSPERDRYSYWLHYAEGSLMPILLMKLIAERIRTSPAPFFVRPITRSVGQRLASTFVDPQVTRHLDFMESELAGRAWFAGAELTAADIQMSYPLEAASARGGLGTRANLSRFLDAVRARPAYQRALARGGPVSLGV